MATQTIRVTAPLPAGTYWAYVQVDGSNTDVYGEIQLTQEANTLFWTFTVTSATAGVYSFQVLNGSTAVVAYGWFYSAADTTRTIQDSDNRWDCVPVSSGGGSSTVLVYPLNASMPVKTTGPNLTFYKDESGSVVGPIQVSARSGNTVTPVDLSGRTLEVRFLDYLGTELLTVVNADISVSGTNDDQFEFLVTTAVTGTQTEDHADQYHYWSLRDVSSGDNVLVAGRARVLLS